MVVVGLFQIEHVVELSLFKIDHVGALMCGALSGTREQALVAIDLAIKLGRDRPESLRGGYFCCGAVSLRQLFEERQSSQKKPHGPQPDSVNPDTVSRTTTRAFRTIRVP